MKSYESREVRADLLATLLCQKLGHKAYKEMLKPFKTFQRFIRQHSHCFSVRPSELIHIDLITCIAEEASSDNCLPAIPEEREVEVSKSPTQEQVCFVSSYFQSLQTLPEIIFVQGDIFEMSWWESADVAYAASLLFSDDMIRRLALLAARMRGGSYFISLKPLHIVVVEHEEDRASLTRLNLISESFFKMSWQMAKVYIYHISPN